MAIMYVTEYGGTASAGGQIEVPQEPPLATPQKIDFTAGSTASAALQDDTQFVSIQLSVDGHIHFAAAPVATIETSRVHQANTVSFHGVKGELKVAALAI